jgi:GcrA cell cycle regulator
MSRFNVANAGWSGGAMAYLREQWPHQTKYELSVVLGCTPNAVVGKAHRLDLPCKPSPIKKPVPEKRTHRPHRKITAAPPRKLKGPKPPKAKPVKVMAFSRYDGDGGCAWPIGHPGQKGFCLCGGDPAYGSPYCDEHYGLAYTSRLRQQAALAAAAA